MAQTTETKLCKTLGVRIVILGGLGYVGAVLASRLSCSMWSSRVVVVDAGWFEAAPTSDYLSGEVEVIRADIRTLKSGFFQEGDILVNLAAISNDAMGQAFDEVTHAINFREAERIAFLAKNAGAKGYVFASSASVYGASGQVISSEKSRCHPQTAYARSKLLAEEALEQHSSDGFPIVCLRFATACGWSPNVRTDLAVNDFVASALTRGAVVLRSGGGSRRPFISVEDMARAIESALVLIYDKVEPFTLANVGHQSWNMTVLSVAELVGEQIGVPLEFPDEMVVDSRDYELDFSHWQSLVPDWSPQHSVTEVIGSLAEGLRERISAGKDVRGPDYIRLERLRSLVRSGALSAVTLERLRELDQSSSKT